MQSRYWMLDQLSPGVTAYNSPIILRLTGPVVVTVLESTINEVVSRHEALRTSFQSENGELMQVIARELTVSLPVEDLTAVPEQDRESEARRLFEDHARVSLDLSRGPLIQCKLIRVGAEDHILALTTHQIVSDGWSNGILVREIASIYELLIQNKPCSLALPELQYADFAVWHNQWLASDQAQIARQSWLKMLDRELPALDLRTDHPRGPAKRSPGAVESVLLPEELVEHLREYCRTHDTTLYVALMGAFQILMSAHSRQKRFVVTSSYAGRTQPGLEGTFGRFAHPQLIVADLDGDPTFEELTSRIQDWCSGVWANQDFPLEKVLDAIGSTREDFQAPSLRAYFIYQKAFMNIYRGRALTITPMMSAVGGASVDMGFGIVERLEGTRVHVEFNTDLFLPASIRRILTQYREVLEAVSTNPHLRISQVSLLGSEDRGFANLAVEPYFQHRCLTELFERQVDLTPDATAAICRGEEWSYRQLNERANRIARLLMERAGVKVGNRVAICLDRSLDMLAALLAVFKTGAACIPMDPENYLSRTWSAVKGAGVVAVITRQRYRESMDEVGSAGPRFMILDREDALAGKTPPQNPAVAVGLADTALAILTADSAPNPALLEFTHASAVNLLESMRNCLQLDSSDVMLAIASVSSGRALVDLLLPLVSGARVVIAPEAPGRKPSDLRTLMDRTRPTVLQATPSILHMLSQSGWAADPKLKVLSGGEVLSRHIAAHLLDRGVQLWSLYGGDEASFWSSAVRMESGTGVVPVGSPLAGAELYVLSSEMQLLPAGVPGDLYVGGLCLARNLSAVHSSRCVPNPFSNRAEPCYLYRTGDVGRYRDDGTIEITATQDKEIAIRERRVNLSEIEAVLESDPGVQQAVVLRHRQAGESLAAYIVVRPQSKVTAASLQAFLRAKLPEYSLPSAIAFLDCMPLTVDGKVDTVALPEPRIATQAADPAYLAPRDAIEARLVEIWERVLGVYPIGVRTSFFDLGGYSLMIVRLFAQINRVFDRNFPIATIFTAPTIELLAEIVRGQGTTGALVPIQTDGLKEPLFVVHSYLLYGALRLTVGQDRPLYGLQEIEDDHGRLVALEDRVARYVQEIRGVQPHGPYRLIGWCAAGPLTVEIARSLRAVGEDVELTGLIDASKPGYSARDAANGGRLNLVKWARSKWQFHSSRMAPLPLSSKGAYVVGMVGNALKVAWRGFLLRYWRMIYAVCRRYGIAPPDFMHNVSWMTFASMRQHEIRPYDGRITLFRASETTMVQGDPTLGWRDVAVQGVDIIWVPGNHESMFREPHLSSFVDALRGTWQETKGSGLADPATPELQICDSQIV
jgi:amino acid adenylation domain-containing protein